MKKMLCWGDSPDAGTGYGTVCKHVVGAFHKTGKYEIHQLSINHHGHFSASTPWQQMPAKVADPSDLHGVKLFCSTLSKGGYDIAWIVNDIYVLLQALPLLKQMQAKKQKLPKLVLYFPVDCAVLPAHKEILTFMDVLVCYNDWSKQQVLNLAPELESKLHVISHGTDPVNFFPLEKDQRDDLRKRAINIDPSTHLVIAVNRNSMRKQIPYSMVAFREFKKKVPNSVFYVHSAIKDQGGDLMIAAGAMGFKPGEILFPAGYSASNPIEISKLNQIYNYGDLFLTTHLGEGYGLTVAESISAGTPVVAPRNTSMPDLMGEKEERGYMYPCRDLSWIDSSGFRPKGLIPDIVQKMLQSYEEGKYGNPKVAAGLAWAKANTWQVMGERWVALMAKIETA